MTLRPHEPVALDWDPVSGSTSYDILLNGVKVSSTKTATTTRLTMKSGDVASVIARPSGQEQDCQVTWGPPQPVPPNPNPGPTPVNGVGCFDVQSYPLAADATSVKSALMATGGAAGPYLVAGVAQAAYGSGTPMVSVATGEAVSPVACPIPPNTKYGSSADRLLQVVGPNGDVYSLSSCSYDSTGKIVYAFGATHVAPPAAGLPPWFEPGPNSTSAGRIPFGWFGVDDVNNDVAKTLTFCCPNLSHAPARYPADVNAGTNFPVTVPGLPTGPPLGTMIRLPKGTAIDPSCTKVEQFMCRRLLGQGAVCRDIGSTWGFYGLDYVNQGNSNLATWQTVGLTLELTNGGVPYAHKFSAAFAKMLSLVEVVAAS